MKILMLGWELPPHNSGGLGVACYQLCKALANTGVDIEFVLPYDAPHAIDFMKITAAQPYGVASLHEIAGVYTSKQYRLPNGQLVASDIYGQQLAYEHAVANLVESTEYEVVHAHDWLTFRAGLRAKQHRQVPLILHVHSIESDRAAGGYGNPLVREIEGLSMMMADSVVAVSQHTKDAIIREYGVPENKITVVHNSIDLDDVEPLDELNTYHYLTYMKAQGYKVITNIGRLTIQKGLPNLLRAAQQVVRHNPKTLFLIVGSGEQYYELIELAAELGISKNVIFTGFLRGQKWRDAFAIADLFVMPSVSEPFGLTPLEAAGYGTPSLISKQSGVAEVLQNCLKVDYWDVDQMANQMLAAITYDGLRQELQANAFQEYQRLGWAPAAEKLLSTYTQHLSEAVA